MPEHFRAQPERKEPALDEIWYERFAIHGSFQAYEQFEQTKQAVEPTKKSLTERTEFSPLPRPTVDPKKFETADRELRALKKEILSQEKNEAVKQAYRWRINEKLAEIRLVQAALEGNVKKFDRFTKFVYGEPSVEAFAWTLEEVKTLIQEAKGKPEFTEASQRLGLLIEQASLPSCAPSPPTHETFANVKEEIETGFAPLIEQIGDAPFDAVRIAETFGTALQQLDATAWKSALVKTTGGISASQETKTVKVPTERTITEVNKLKELIVHELGTHVLRRENGERSALKLLGLGLDRYEGFEEGVAGVREDVLSESFQGFAGLEGNLAIGLALGVDGTKRNMREVYEILEDYYLLKKGLEGSVPAPALTEKAKDLAWARALRTFRGTDGKTAGVAFTKDVIYREGSIAAWDVLSKRPEGAQERWNIGKFDDANPRHLWILRQLEILDEEVG